MRATVKEINGLYVIYEINGKEYMDDSTFSEILALEKGDVLDITAKRFKQLSERNREKNKNLPGGDA